LLKIGGNIMKRKKITQFFVFIFVSTIITVGFIANADILQNDQQIYQTSIFDAEITFYVLTGEGCGCTPIKGVSVSAYGGEGNDSGVTDEDGMCILTLVINSEYEVYIEGEGYHNIDFEFNVIDNQMFIFHLFEKKGSSINSNLINFQFLNQLLKGFLIQNLNLNS
jgi:hypothetical protein